MKNDKIGEIIQERRVYLNLTQKDVAEMAGTTFKSISEIELGIETLNHELENFSKNHAQESYLADLPKALFHIKVIEIKLLQ